MTAIDGAGRETSTCEALLGSRPDETASLCGRPGARYRTLGCVHEHVVSGYLCDRCLNHAARPGCIQCFDVDGHDCPLSDLAVEAVAR